MSVEADKGNWPSRLRSKPVWLGGAAIVLLVVAWTVWPSSKGSAVQEFHTVKRGDFLISIVEGGTLEAVNEVVVRSEVEGTARIIKMVPEGTYVKKGDLLVELDSSQAQDQVNQQLIAYEKARFALIAAQETLSIQKSVVESEISAAELKLEFAKRDLQKYLEGEARQLKRNLEIEISTVQENLVVAKDRYDWSKKLHAKGFETKSNLDKDQLAVLQYTLKLEQATNALAMFDHFDFPKQKRQLESAMEEAGKELARVRLQGEGKLKQYQADVKTQESTVELNKSKLERDQANLAGCKIHAPQDGLVVYAMGNNRFSNESLIEEGATIRNRQELIKLPDVSEMKLAIKIHESHINMIRQGLGAYVVLDSMPDQRFRGTVRKVSLLPDSSSRWGNPNLKVYATEILLVDKLPPDVKPGVSARAEIVITNMQNVLTVPLQAITTKQGKQVAYVESGGDLKPLPVNVGMYNTRLIQIVSGLNEGDRVSLAPPNDGQDKDLGGAILDGEEAGAITNLPVAPTFTDARPNGNGGGAEFAEANGPRGTARSEPGFGPSGDGPGRRSGTREGGASFGPPGEGRGTSESGGERRAGGRFNREEMLKQFDKDGDGEINEEERNAMRAAMRERFGAGGAERRPPGGGESGIGGGRERSGGDAGTGPRRDSTRPTEPAPPTTK
jgi:HlyD family secretion protein